MKNVNLPIFCGAADLNQNNASCSKIHDYLDLIFLQKTSKISLKV
jgi:hypothetical protein